MYKFAVVVLAIAATAFADSSTVVKSTFASPAVLPLHAAPYSSYVSGAYPQYSQYSQYAHYPQSQYALSGLNYAYPAQYQAAYPYNAMPYSGLSTGYVSPMATRQFVSPLAAHQYVSSPVATHQEYVSPLSTHQQVVYQKPVVAAAPASTYTVA